MESILGQDFNTRIHTSRRSTVRAFKARVSKTLVDNKARNHWKAAWKIFKTESSYYIPTPKCIRRGDSQAALKRSRYKLEYRREEAKRLIPYFEAKSKYAKGRALKNIEGVLELLRAWKGEFANFSSSSEDEDISFERADSPPPILLPLPPSGSNGRRVFQRSGAVDTPVELSDSSSDSEFPEESGDEWERESQLSAGSSLPRAAVEASRNIRWRLF